MRGRRPAPWQGSVFTSSDVGPFAGGGWGQHGAGPFGPGGGPLIPFGKKSPAVQSVRFPGMGSGVATPLADVFSAWQQAAAQSGASPKSAGVTPQQVLAAAAAAAQVPGVGGRAPVEPPWRWYTGA